MKPFTYIQEIKDYLQQVADHIVGPLSVNATNPTEGVFPLLITPCGIGNSCLEMEVYPYANPEFTLIMAQLQSIYDELFTPTPSVEELEALWNA